jgi:serine/threonine protein kinase
VPCLIIEYLPSVSLAIALNDDGPMDPVEVARIGSQVAAAMAAAHAAGIVHRDIKPGNILLGDDGTVKITDFGISRATDDVTVTKTGLIAGTPAYLAPEVAIGREPSAASDMFSLGSTLYAAAEGEPPFGLSENTLGLLHAVASGKIVPPTRSGPLTDVLMLLLAVDPDDRPTAGRARDLLSAVSRGEEPNIPLPSAAEPDVATRLVIATDPSAAGPPIEPPVKSAKPLMFASAAVTVAMAAGAWLLFGGGGNANPIEKTPTNINSVPTTSSTYTEVITTEGTTTKTVTKTVQPTSTPSVTVTSTVSSQPTSTTQSSTVPTSSTTPTTAPTTTTSPTTTTTVPTSDGPSATLIP